MEKLFREICLTSISVKTAEFICISPYADVIRATNIMKGGKAGGQDNVRIGVF